MSSSKTKIKNKSAIELCLRSIAYQIYENNEEEKELIIVGIGKNGKLLAEKIYKILKSISNIKLIFVELIINKKNPTDKIKSSIKKENLKNKSIIIIDDVLNTGSTLIYAAKYFLQIPVKKIQTAVIINRNHKKFPIKADFKGLSLSTSIKEHVNVVLEGVNQGVFLS